MEKSRKRSAWSTMRLSGFLRRRGRNAMPRLIGEWNLIGTNDTRVAFLRWYRCIDSCLTVLEKHHEPITSISWIPDGKGFISCAFDTWFCHWTDTGELLHILHEDYIAQTSCITPDGCQLIVADRIPKIHYYDFRTCAKIRSITIEDRAISIMVDLDSNLAQSFRSFSKVPKRSTQGNLCHPKHVFRREKFPCSWMQWK